jgi:TolA-binding protein
MKRGIPPKGKWLFYLLFVLSIALPIQVIFGLTLDSNDDPQEPNQDKADSIPSIGSEKEIMDPEILFYLGKTEEDGDSSRCFFQEISMHFPHWKNADAARLVLSKYQFSKGMYLTAVDMTGEFIKSYPTGANTPELLWISGCSFLAADQPDSALLKFKRIQESYPGSIWAAWAELGIGDCLFALRDYEQAVVEFQRILDDYRDSEAFAFAIFGLIQCYRKLEEPEQALFYHNLLKERYPASLELLQNPNEVINNRGQEGDKSRAEQLAGVKYTIQLGLFAKKEEASQLRSHFKEHGYTVNIKSKIISGKKYHVVTVGSFISYQEARKLKEELESKIQGSYRIVIE